MVFIFVVKAEAAMKSLLTRQEQNEMRRKDRNGMEFK